MIALGADEDLDRHIVTGLRRRLKDADIVRVQDVGLTGSSDADVLDWAAHNSRVLLTHDVSTMTAAAHLIHRFELLIASDLLGCFALLGLEDDEVLKEIEEVSGFKAQQTLDRRFQRIIRILCSGIVPPPALIRIQA